MRFCKDCVHYTAAVSGDGGTLLPGYFFHIPAECGAVPSPIVVNIVTGEKSGGHPEYCSSMRDVICGKCGPDAQLFKPANLDGRLAMLPEAE